MNVSKLDAARRQLESSVRLFFAEADPVSIHTLVGAARTLLADLCRAEGRGAGLEAALLEIIRPEKRGEVVGTLSEDQNFFKHADRDPDAVLDFNPETTQILLWDACQLYKSLTDEVVPLLGVFNVWWALSYPAILLPEVQAEATKGAETFNPQNRRKFFEEFLPVAERWVLNQPS